MGGNAVDYRFPDIVYQRGAENSLNGALSHRFHQRIGWVYRIARKELTLLITMNELVGKQTVHGQARNWVGMVGVAEQPALELVVEGVDSRLVTDHGCAKSINLVHIDHFSGE